MKKFLNLTILLGLFCVAQSQTPCEAGFAGTYPCNNVDLINFIPLADFPGPPADLNDVWGWTDPLDGKEFAIVGMRNGTGFVDIDDPLNPVVLGYLPTATSNSLWRDVKVYNDHAFIVSEAGGHGMQVFDLTRLRSVPVIPETFTADAHFTTIGSAHNIVMNEATGTAFAVGADDSGGSQLYNGGLVIIDVTDPLNPSLAGDYGLEGYTHDAQVVIYNGPDTDHVGKEVAFNCNAFKVVIADVTDPTDATTIASETYATEGYTHQGWLTEDHRFWLVGDELDESQGNVTNTTTYIWDVQDLDNPFLLGTYESTTSDIDHNLYVDANLVYQSNYKAGLRILDDTDVAAGNLNEVAFFDLFPSASGSVWNGSWSNYPYYASGIVVATSIEEGLFLLKPRFINSDQASVSVCETGDAVYDINLEEGWIGPVNLAAMDLPAGVTASFSANDVTPPTTVQMTLSNLTSAGGATFNPRIVGTGTHFNYEVTVEMVPQASTTYYADTDNDGFGSASSAVQDCVQPAGYVTDDTDCDDTRDDVYPGAPGTGEDIDNNCNGLVEGDEESAPCPADLNNDGIINAADLLVFLGAFGCNTPPCVADFDDNGITNAADLLFFLAAFGSFCP